VKVTYIAGSLRDGGAERQLLELIRHLDRSRFAPSVILMEDAGVERARECVEQCFVIGIPQGGNSSWLKRGLKLANGIHRTRMQLRKWKSEVVHAILPGPSILGGIAARLAAVPVVIGSRLSFVSLYRSHNGVVALADRMAFHMAHLNLGNSAAVITQMVNPGGCPPRKCHTIYCGVDTHRFRPELSRSWRKQMGWGEQHVVFGMVANFRACKRHTDFVQAAAIVLQQFPDARFVMVGGDYGLREVVSKQISELGLEQRVRIIDSDPHPEKVFAALDVYVCTSDSEGFSNVLLEAMACGKPVIATNVGGNPEAVVDGETGLLVACKSPRAVADAAEKLIREPGRRLVMGRLGRQRVEQHFSLERMVRMHEQLYLELLAKRKKMSA